jgi:hypothetical protein
VFDEVGEVGPVVPCDPCKQREIPIGIAVLSPKLRLECVCHQRITLQILARRLKHRRDQTADRATLLSRRLFESRQEFRIDFNLGHAKQVEPV